MTTICFVGTYPPIMCGIATYTSYLTAESAANQWGALSFDLDKYGAPLTSSVISESDPVCYGISGKRSFCAREILEGLDKLGISRTNTILWFQHETAIWADTKKFVFMLKSLDLPKIVSFHTLHFQSPETPWGLRAYQYNLLQSIFPHVDAITVFSRGVYWAVISAFPEYCTKISVLRHGIHDYPSIRQMNREKARQGLYDYLMHESDLDPESRKCLANEGVLSDSETVILGQTGFLCPLKQTESLYEAQYRLQKKLPDKRVMVMRIGEAREDSHSSYAARLRKEMNNPNSCLINTWLPDNMLALAQKAFDINFYWPSDCTQSGIMAHALGTNAIIGGRDIEGVGETLHESGEIVDSDINRLTQKMKNVLTSNTLISRIEKRVDAYSREYSWKNQVRRHYELADAIHPSDNSLPKTSYQNEKDPLVALATGTSGPEITDNPGVLENLLADLEDTLRSNDGYPKTKQRR